MKVSGAPSAIEAGRSDLGFWPTSGFFMAGDSVIVLAPAPFFADLPKGFFPAVSGCGGADGLRPALSSAFFCAGFFSALFFSGCAFGVGTDFSGADLDLESVRFSGFFTVDAFAADALTDFATVVCAAGFLPPFFSAGLDFSAGLAAVADFFRTGLFEGCGAGLAVAGFDATCLACALTCVLTGGLDLAAPAFTTAGLADAGLGAADGRAVAALLLDCAEGREACFEALGTGRRLGASLAFDATFFSGMDLPARAFLAVLSMLFVAIDSRLRNRYEPDAGMPTPTARFNMARVGPAPKIPKIAQPGEIGSRSYAT